MDVINLSLGEPEIEPTRDLVTLAIDGAAAAGVPTVAAAGNEYGRLQLGSVGSPASAATAISVASVSNGRSEPAGAISSFSSAGPTPLSLRLKPDVSAPGSSILSSTPEGSWSLLSGTSMASPHVAGAVALLRKRHPEWTPAQLRSALVTDGFAASERAVADRRRRYRRRSADTPLLFAEPSSISFGLVSPGKNPEVVVKLADAGGGAGTWSVSGIFATPRTVTVPGELRIPFAEVAHSSAEEAGYVVLQRGDQIRRIPYWFRVTTPQLPRATRTLTRTGTYSGSTVGKPRRVQQYRYPVVANSTQPGPEQVFRFVLGRAVANFGVTVLRGDVQPRVVQGRREPSRRHRGPAGQHQPLRRRVRRRAADRRRDPSGAGHVRPRLRLDGRSRRRRFTFRFWVDDATADTPAARRDRSRRVVRVRVSDARPASTRARSTRPSTATRSV